MFDLNIYRLVNIRRETYIPTRSYEVMKMRVVVMKVIWEKKIKK